MVPQCCSYRKTSMNYYRDEGHPILNLSYVGDPAFAYFLDCLDWYRFVRWHRQDLKYVSSSFEKVASGIQDEKTLNATILLSTYARWCLEYVFYVDRHPDDLYPRYIQFFHTNCFGCVLYKSSAGCMSCPLCHCCKTLQDYSTGFDTEYDTIVICMLEMLRDTTLEAVEELGFIATWTWLPYFEDSVLEARFK